MKRLEKGDMVVSKLNQTETYRVLAIGPKRAKLVTTSGKQETFMCDPAILAPLGGDMPGSPLGGEHGGEGEAITLLPCPFCGHPPRLRSGKVKCVNNQCKVRPKTQAWYVKGCDHHAAADWNGRAGVSDCGGASK